MFKPLVSIVLVSHNHDRFIKEAIDSVLNQTYQNFELIIVDDYSVDDTYSIIEDYIKKEPLIKFFPSFENLGICSSFNKGLNAAKGDYVIDFAADDVMLPNRLEEQVKAFEGLNDEYTMCFSDAVYIDEESKVTKNHFKRSSDGILREKVPTGDVYQDVLEKYFICTPTMMMRVDHLREMGGYDINLKYEDFDYWIRASRKFKFHYLDMVLTAKRVVPNSHGKKFAKTGFEEMHKSTLEVCKKAYKQNTIPMENAALAKRMKYEMRQCYFTKNYRVCLAYARLLKKLKSLNSADALISSLAKNKINVSGLYQKVSKSAL